MSPRASLLLLLLFMPLLSHTLAQPSPAVGIDLTRIRLTVRSKSDELLSQGLLEEVAGSARHTGGHGAARTRDARLPLPTPQEIDALRKVAQILAMLGEQVLG